MSLSPYFLEKNAEQATEFLQRALRWAQDFPACLFLDNQGIAYPGGGFPKMLAVGRPLHPPAQSSPFQWLEEQWAEHGWLFGYLGYDLKNHLEDLNSQNKRLSLLPDMGFFAPEHFIQWREDGRIALYSSTPEQVEREVLSTPLERSHKPMETITFNPLTSKEDYLTTVRRLQPHILEGDIYEINYCMAFEAEAQSFDPVLAYQKLRARSPMPFSAFLKMGEHYALCASPERFLRKDDNALISQPIKGTIKRGRDSQEDEQLKQQLRNSEKEQAENLMIVDLVRNDLARSAAFGTVEVGELFGIYTFEQLHQMISTVKAELRPGFSPIQALANAFPMGSMTGAPKVKSMELIERYEEARRGAFSGAIGFLSPDGNFDFNVVIRSQFYEAAQQKLSYQVGSAITYDANPEYEYEECLLKARGLGIF